MHFTRYIPGTRRCCLTESELNERSQQVIYHKSNTENSERVQEQVAWPALQYLTGQIIYGGCVTDDNDRVLLTELCQRCYQPGVLQPGFAFTPDTALSPPPPDADMPACLEHIQALPATDSALLFGMHANADTAYQLQVNIQPVCFIWDVPSSRTLP